jgi:hypothetical protein
VSASLRRAVLVLGVLGLVSGVAGLIYSAGEPFAGAGTRLGAFMSFNGLGAVVTLALAVLSLVAGVAGRRPLVLAAGVGHLLGALLVVVGLGLGVRLLGGNGSTLSYFLGLGFGLLALGLSAAEEPRWQREHAA